MKTNPSRFTDPRLEKLFNLEELPQVTLEITTANWNQLLFAFDSNPGVNFWIPGDFVFKGSHCVPDQTIHNIGLRVRGNTSRNRPEGDYGQPHNPINPVWRQASFALQFARYEGGQNLEGQTRLDLKFVREDPMRIREVYSFDLYQQAEIYTGPLMSMCRFYINIIDGYPNKAYFGIYKLKEFIEDDYLATRKTIFGDDNPGSHIPFLWKGDFGAGLNDYDPSVIEDRDIYDLRTNTSYRSQANAQLTDFVHNLVNLEGEDLKNWADQIMGKGVHYLMKSYIASVICGNMDDYWSESNNLNFYFNTHGKFFFIPNDFDTSLGTGWGIDAGKQSPFNWGKPGNPLIQRLLSVPEFKQSYIQAFHELTNAHNGPFHVSRSIPRIQEWLDLIEDHLWDDTVHFGCEWDGSGCILRPGKDNLQTPFEDSTAWWSSTGLNAYYKLLETGDLNFFEVSGDQERV